MHFEQDRRSIEHKPFLDHLEDLRWTIIKTLAALVIGVIITSIFIPQIFDILKKPLTKVQIEMGLKEEQVSLVALRPGEGIMNLMKVAAFSGVVVSLPAALYFLLQFAMPAMTSREKKVIIPGLGAGLGLFVAGLCFCYFLTLPLMVRMMWKINTSFGLKNVWTLSYYLSFVTGFMLANGLIFELPLLLFILVKLNVISINLLRRGRRHAIVLMFIIGGILTPPDPFTIFLVALPMVFLYEACIWIAVLTSRKSADEESNM
jgi:sec-independent protein translocase protein TatC